MSVFFLASLFAAGIALIFSPLFRKKQSAAMVRLRDVMAAEKERDGAERAEAIATKKQRQSLTVTLRDRLASHFDESRVLGTAEGRDLIDWLDQQLVLAGLRLRPQQAISLALICIAVSVGLTFLMFAAGFPLLVVLGPLVIAAYPFLKLRSLQQKRRTDIQAEVPWILQELVMALSSGAITIDGALAKLAARAKDHPQPLLSELARAVREYQLGGISREQALRGVAERTGDLSVRTFVETLITALQVGGENLGEMLSGYQKQAQAMWLSDMQTYIDKQLPMFILGLVLAMFGGLALIVGTLVISHFG
jgi:Flp pilus assembly protein TadB